MVQSPRSPKPTEQQWTNRIKELEDGTKNMERSQKAAERKRAQDLREAKKKLSRELQAAQRNLTRSEHEASKLAGQLTRTEHQAQQAAARKVREADRLEDGIGRIRQKHGKVNNALRDKMTAVGQARGRLAHAQMAMSLLEEKGVIISVEALQSSGQGREDKASSQGQDFGGQTEKDLHDGETQERDDLICKLRDSHDELQEENLQLREHLLKAEQRCSAAVSLLAEAQAVLESKAKPGKLQEPGDLLSCQNIKDTARSSLDTFSSTKDDSETVSASNAMLNSSQTDFTLTASTQPALPITVGTPYCRSNTPRPFPTLLATMQPLSKAGPMRMTSCPGASPLQRYRVIQDKPTFTSVAPAAHTTNFMEPTALKSQIVRREPVAISRVQSEMMAWS